MPGPLSETVSSITPCSFRTSTIISGATPAVSQASRALSINSFRQTLANSLVGTPVSVESCRASKYSAAREVSKVVRSSFVFILPIPFNNTDNAAIPKYLKGAGAPLEDAPALSVYLLRSRTHDDAIERVGRCSQNAGVLDLQSTRDAARTVEPHSTFPALYALNGVHRYPGGFSQGSPVQAALLAQLPDLLGT